MMKSPRSRFRVTGTEEDPIVASGESGVAGDDPIGQFEHQIQGRSRRQVPDFILGRTNELVGSAKDEIRNLPAGPALDLMLELADGVITRDA